MKHAPGTIKGHSFKNMTIHVIGTCGEVTFVILLNRHYIKQLLKTYLYRLIYLSTLIREASTCSRWWFTPRPTTGKDSETYNFYSILSELIFHIVSILFDLLGLLLYKMWSVTVNTAWALQKNMQSAYVKQCSRNVNNVLVTTRISILFSSCQFMI